MIGPAVRSDYYYFSYAAGSSGGKLRHLKNLPLVSVIIPCLNEEGYISQCLDSILSNDYPKDRLEVLAVDGLSEDRTREIVEDYAKENLYIRVIDNPKRTTPCALNTGISHAKGEIIVRIDAHANYSDDYISKCVEYMNQYDAQNVGGILITEPRENTRFAKSIALVFAHPFGSGNAYYKAGHPSEIKWVDTVPFGCFRKEVFDKIGLFNEHLSRSQDIEFNKRLRKEGGRILLVPDIKSVYYVRSGLKDFFKHNIRDGAWVIRPFEYAEVAISLRHLVPLLFVSSLVFSLSLGLFRKAYLYLVLLILSVYLSFNAYFSLKVARGEGDYRLVPYCMIAFASRHFGFGLGSFSAIPGVLASRGFWRIRIGSLRDRLLGV